MANEKGWSKQKVLAVLCLAVIVLAVLVVFRVYAIPSTLNTNDKLQNPTPTPYSSPSTSSTPTPSPRLYSTQTPKPSVTPTPTPMPGLPSPPPPYLSLSMNPSTANVNEQVSGNITTNIHAFNATVTYINTQSGEAKQRIVPCVNNSGQFSVFLTQAGSYSFVAEFAGISSNTVQVSIT